MSEWAPLVFARTYSEDYRLIVIPTGFDPQDERWARKYILGTFETFSAEGHNDPLRWSVFKDRYCVVGMTCMAYQLRTDKLQDEKGRQGLQVFLGYVFNRNSSLSALPPMEVGLFEQLYIWVEKHWSDQAWQQDSPERYGYLYNLPRGNFPDTRGWHLNTEEQTTLIRPVTFNHQLWAIASMQARKQRPFSLCLNLSRQSLAQEGPFLNSSTFDFPRGVDKPIFLPKSVSPSSQYSSPAIRPSTERGRPAMPRPSPSYPQAQIANERTQAPGPGFLGSIMDAFGNLILGPTTQSEDTRRSRDTEFVNRSRPRNSPPPGFTYKESEESQADLAPTSSSGREIASRKDKPPAGFTYKTPDESRDTPIDSEDFLSQEKEKLRADFQAKKFASQPEGELHRTEEMQSTHQQDTLSGEAPTDSSRPQEGVNESRHEEPSSND